MAVRWDIELSEQVLMASGSDQKNFGWGNVVNQEPIRLDVALPQALPLAREFVRVKSGRQFAFFNEQFDDPDEVFNVFAAPYLALEVPLKARVLPDPPHDALK
jgi:hypothetical protein